MVISHHRATDNLRPGCAEDVAVNRQCDRKANPVAQYAENPASLANQVKRLQGEERLWRLRVGDWRVIFNQDMVVVHVVRVASRGSAYD